jgi:hypothetical protein
MGYRYRPPELLIGTRETAPTPAPIIDDEPPPY